MLMRTIAHSNNINYKYLHCSLYHIHYNHFGLYIKLTNSMTYFTDNEPFNFHYKFSFHCLTELLGNNDCPLIADICYPQRKQ